MGRARQVIFRIFYSTTFTAVFILTIVIICVTPGDAIYESYRRSRLLDIFIITGAYVLTALFAMLIYASRLYTNRSVLKDIPKTFMPIEKEDLPTRRVHRLIDDCLIKSSVVAYTSKPRSRLVENESNMVKSRMLDVVKPNASPGDRIWHHWGPVAHLGWSSPASANLPDLEYAAIVSELPSLIEAKAVSLAPVDPLATPGEAGVPMPDAKVIVALTRPSAMGMRPYFSKLVNYGVIPDSSTSGTFLTTYERARFSSSPLSAEDFQALMKLFAEVLRSMTKVEPGLLNLEDFEDDNIDDADSDQGEAADGSSLSDTGSVRHNALDSSRLGRTRPLRRMSEDSVDSELEARFLWQDLESAIAASFA